MSTTTQPLNLSGLVGLLAARNTKPIGQDAIAGFIPFTQSTAAGKLFSTVKNPTRTGSDTFNFDCGACGIANAATCKTTDSAGIESIACRSGCQPKQIAHGAGITTHELGINPKTGTVQAKEVPAKLKPSNSGKSSYEEIQKRILERIDILAEYVRWGFEATNQPNSKGIVNGWALGRPHGNSPNAMVNTITGVYSTLGKDKESLNFWQAAAKYGGYSGWREARDAYAQKIGLENELPGKKKKGPKSPHEKLSVIEWNSEKIQGLLDAFPGFTEESLRLCGAKLAYYLKGSRYEQLVVALPTHDINKNVICGYCIMRADGGKIPLHGREEKRVNIGPSGFIGYGIEKLLKNPKTIKIVIKPEGVSDCLTILASMPIELRENYAVITNACGASEKQLPYETANRFNGIPLFIVLHDNDEPGQTGALIWLDAMSGKAEKVVNAVLDSVKDGRPIKDARDYLNNGGTFQGIIDAAEKSQLTPQAGTEQAPGGTLGGSPFDEKLLADIDLEVLGEIESSGGKVKVFSGGYRKTDVIPEPARLTYERLLQICGPAVKKFVHQGSDDIPGLYTLKDVRQAIAVVSGQRRIGNDSEFGRGIWRGKADNLKPCNSLVLVGAGEAARWNGDGILHRVKKPRSDGLMLDFGNPSQWYDLESLHELIKKASNTEWSRSVYLRAYEIFSRWKWKRGISPHVVVCLILATFIQTIWAWRPQIMIIGETNAGKSLLFEALAKIFGAICLKSSSSSAAGIRQAIRHSATIILCDEIDSNKERQAIFDMIRLSSRGDSVLKGTTSHKSQEFSLRHIILLTGIESGIEQEQDRNRFITLELIPPTTEEMGQLRVPSDAELAELGQELLAIAICHGIRSVDMAMDLKRERFENCNQRVVESYAPLAAMNIAACGEIPQDGESPSQGPPYGTRREILGMLLNLGEEPKEFEQDKNRLLQFIFSSVIDIGHGQRESVARSIKRRLISSDYPEALERVGIKICDEGMSIFIAHNEIKRKLLKGSDWERKNIAEILERIGGAEPKSLRIVGVQNRGFIIPSTHELISGDEF